MCGGGTRGQKHRNGRSRREKRQVRGRGESRKSRGTLSWMMIQSSMNKTRNDTDSHTMKPTRRCRWTYHPIVGVEILRSVHGSCHRGISARGIAGVGWHGLLCGLHNKTTTTTMTTTTTTNKKIKINPSCHKNTHKHTTGSSQV